MTLLYDSFAPDRAQLHALVIGVGDYPYLLDGSEAGEVTLGLGQLRSPIVSARALAAWLTSRYANSRVPLGSVDLLLSSDDANRTRRTPRAATFAEIRDAFSGWKKRVLAHPDNVALFYFCGHGIQKESLNLLAEDFAQPGRPLEENAIDFDATATAMKQSTCKKQLYFLDCCRIDLGMTSCGRALVGGNPSLPVQDQGIRHVYYATGKGGEAHAPRHEDDTSGSVSYFTHVLIRCLDGLAAQRLQDGRWGVSTAYLSGILAETCGKMRPRGAPTSMTAFSGEASGSFVINEPDTGRVWTSVTCLPSEALDSAHLRVLEPGGREKAARSPRPEPWCLELEAGTYEFHASFAHVQYQPTAQEYRILPPTWHCELEV